MPVCRKLFPLLTATTAVFLWFSCISPAACQSTGGGESLAEMNAKGIAAFKEHEYDKAEAIFKTALDKAYSSPDKSWVGTIMTNLSAIYSAQGKQGESDRAMLEAEAIKSKLSGVSFKPADNNFASSAKRAPQDSSLSGYVSETKILKPLMPGRGPAAKPSLQAQAPVSDPSLSLRPRTKSATTSGAVEWGDWPEPPELLKPPPFQRTPPPPPPEAACDPCQDGFAIRFRVVGIGIGGAANGGFGGIGAAGLSGVIAPGGPGGLSGLIGPGGLGGPGGGLPPGVRQLFDYSGTISP